MTAKKKGEAKFSLYLSDRAISDLLEIESYSIANWGKSAANRYMLKFEKAFRLLEANPDLARPDPQLGSELLFYRVEKHLLGCVGIKKGMVVLTITHASRDIENLLHELTPSLRFELEVLLTKIRQTGNGFS